MVGIREAESLPDKITNDEIHYAARPKHEPEPQQGQAKSATSNKTSARRVVSRTAE
jgi:hypothetical protein